LREEESVKRKEKSSLKRKNEYRDDFCLRRQLEERGDRIKDIEKRERNHAMMDTAVLLSAPEWAQATFAEARLGDQRRTKRVVRMATLMAT